MRASLLGLGLSVVLLGAAPASAEESLPVPQYPDFMEICLSSVVDQNSDREAFAMAGVLCHCTYENIGQRTVMTKPVFTDAMRSCGQAAQRDPEGFVKTYLPRVRAAMIENQR